MEKPGLVAGLFCFLLLPVNVGPHDGYAHRDPSTASQVFKPKCERMATLDFSEVYTLLGATLGFVATGFGLWDRMFRYRPSISITVEHAGARAFLRVKNQAPYDIIIEEIISTSLHYRVDSADSLLGIINGVMGHILPVLLSPNEERLLRIHEREISGVKAENTTDRVRIEVRWTRGDHPYLRPAAVRLWTSPADIARRKRAAEMWAGEKLEQLPRHR